MSKEGQPRKIGRVSGAFATALLIAACESNAPIATPTPIRTPEATPLPTPTLVVTPSPSPEVTPTPVVTPSPSPEVTPTPVVTPSPSPEVTPTETPSAMKTGEDIVNAEHPNVKLDKLSDSVIAAFEGNDEALAAYQAYMGDNPDYSPENQTQRCGKSYPIWEDRASECEYLIKGFMETYKATKEESFYNITLDAYNYFLHIKDIPNAEKERFSEVFAQDY